MSSYKVTGWHHINPVFCYVGNIALMLTVSKLRSSVCKRTGAKNGLFTLPFTWTFQQLRGHQRNILLSVNLGAFVDIRSDSVNSFRMIQPIQTSVHECFFFAPNLRGLPCYINGITFIFLKWLCIIQQINIHGHEILIQDKITKKNLLITMHKTISLATILFFYKIQENQFSNL